MGGEYLDSPRAVIPCDRGSVTLFGVGRLFTRSGVVLVIGLMTLLASCAQSGDATTTTAPDEDTTTTRPERSRSQQSTRATTTTSEGSTTTTSEPDTTTTTGPQSSTTTTSGDTFSSSTTTTVGPSSGIGLTGQGTVAVIGCSNSSMAAFGYAELSDVDLLSQGGLGGGSWGIWGDPSHAKYSEYWGYYEDRRPAGGYSGVWMQICLRSGEHDGTLTDEINGWSQHVVSEVQRRDGGIPIWISGLNFYDFACSSTGSNGSVVAGAGADWASASLAGVSRGPDLGPLSANEVRGDDCHPNDAGRLVLGAQLVAFFDGA